MRKLLVVLLMLALGLILIVASCGQEESDTSGDEPEGVKEAESRDTTAMDSAALEAVPPDTIASQHDSM